MEEDCLACLSPKKNTSAQNIEQTSPIIPIYVITRSLNAPDLSTLTQFLEEHSLLYTLQNSTSKLQKMDKTYQDKFFIILNDFSNANQLSGQFKNINYQCVVYPLQDEVAVLNKYASFTQKVHRDVKNSPKKQETSNNLNFIYKSNDQQGQFDENRSRIVLKCVSKIKNSYKNGWPKRLFVYSNRNDDQRYQKYVQKLKDREFKDVNYIEHIEEYLKQLADKEDQIFAILMSQYSAVHLRKYFKKSDQIILLAYDQQECMPLLRGKVTYLTTITSTLDSYLAKQFDMKQKKREIAVESRRSSVKEEDKYTVSQKQVSEKSTVSKSFLRKSKRNWEQDMCLRSVLSYKISPQYSIVNEPVKQLKLESNIVMVSVTPQPSVIKQSQLIPICSKKESIPQVESKIAVRQGIAKTSPLEIVQMEQVSVMNISQQSGISSQQPSMFDQISNVEKAQHDIDQSWQISRTSMKQNIEHNYGDNSSYGSSSSCSYFSKASRNSRIFDRVKQRAKVKRKINFDNL